VARFAPIALSPSITLLWERVYLLGVINVTPDSFSDGGKHIAVASAVAFGLRSVAAGADVLDVGGESTRPGAMRVEDEEEIARVVPVIEGLFGGLLEVGCNAPISVDTTKSRVARAALEAGATIVNDISGGCFDPDLVHVVADSRAAFVLGHVRGQNLAEAHAAERSPPEFDEVAAELGERVARLPADLRLRTLVDPGIGFGKGAALDLELCGRAGELGARTGRPVLVGPSRKRFLGTLVGSKPAAERDDATIGACLAAVASGASALRVHDVGRVRDALTAFSAVSAAGGRAC
jgi:dihydropteroate synthase